MTENSSIVLSDDPKLQWEVLLISLMIEGISTKLKFGESLTPEQQSLKEVIERQMRDKNKT